MNPPWSDRFSALARRTHPPVISWLMAQALEVPGLISLAAGFVDQSTLPSREVESALLQALAEADVVQSPLQYGTTYGDLALRRLLVQRLRREEVWPFHTSLDENQVMVGSGSQQLLYLACEALLDEGDIVLLEAPTYFVVLGAIAARGARTIGLDTDADGLCPEALESSLARLEAQGDLPRVKLLYLMTYATNPLGVTLSPPRRRKVMDVLQTYRDRGFPILLLEDAAYRRLCFSSQRPLPLKSLDESGDLVLYTESFSKSLSPGLRLGYAAGPSDLIAKMVDLKGNHDFGSANVSQQIARILLASGAYDRHVEMLKACYAGKCALVQRLLDEQLPPEASHLVPSGGFYTWIMLPPVVDTSPASRLFQQALHEKVLYVPGCLCYSGDRPESRFSSSLRLSFGMIDEARLEEGCRRLMRALIHALAPVA